MKSQMSDILKWQEIVRDSILVDRILDIYSCVHNLKLPPLIIVVV